MATYYVDATGGSNSNAGTSTGAPWQTLAKVNTSAGAGDTVYLKRGEVWRETLTVPAAGMTFDAYGAGTAYPSIRGSDTKNSTGDWTLESFNGLNLYYTSVANDPVFLSHDGVLGQNIKGDQPKKTSKAAIAKAWDWYYDSGTGRVYTYANGANPASVASLIEVGARTECVATMYQDNTLFRQIEFAQTRGASSIMVLLWGGATVNFYRCAFRQIAAVGIQYNNGCKGSVVGCCFSEYNVADYDGGFCVHVIGSTPETGPVSVYRNTFQQFRKCLGNQSDPIMCDAGGWIDKCIGNVIDYTPGGHGIVIYEPASIATSILIEGNWMRDLDKSGIIATDLDAKAGTKTITIRRNYIENFGVKDDADTEGIRARLFTASGVNIISNVLNGAPAGVNAHFGIHCQNTQGAGTKIYNNTVYGCETGVYRSGTTSGIDIRNNIFKNNRSAATDANGGSFATNNYNCTHGNGSVGATQGANSITSDPQLANPAAGNLRIPSGSPCKAAGVSGLSGVTSDCWGAPYAATPAIGAYEAGPTAGAFMNVR